MLTTTFRQRREIQRLREAARPAVVVPPTAPSDADAPILPPAPDG
jgi:hypothetical protein